ncbi:MAG: PIG-L family deacetylase [Kibdelosporangium sp.]
MATVVAFPAHPDDEVLHMGGTLALAAADGHRTVVVAATDGLMGEADGEPPRLAALRASAAALKVARVESLLYADSGHGKDLYPDPADRPRFVRAGTGVAAERLAAILRAEKADILLVHDANGGYGHRDHVHAHHVGMRAAALAGVPRVLAATMPRDLISRVVKVAGLFGYDPKALSTMYSPREAITHSLDVRRFAQQKQSALAAHVAGMSSTGRSAKLFKLLADLPLPVFALVFGREWFAEVSGVVVGMRADAGVVVHL